jgi:serine/threonine protein phosphatase PrpC
MGIFSSTPSIAASSCTDISVLGDQGVTVSDDANMVMRHNSNVPHSYYKWKYQVEGGMNMDRGGFGCVTRRGVPHKMYACAFDGVSHGGKINAYAAQSFAQNCMAALEKASLHGFGKDIKSYWSGMYTSLQNHELNPGNLNINYDAAGGSATAVSVSLSRQTTGWSIDGAGVGDAAAILIKADGSPTTQLNTVSRLDESAMDTGGQLEMCNHSPLAARDLSVFSTRMETGDLLLLATDGLTDNCALDIMSFVVSMPYFDDPVTTICPWTNFCRTCGDAKVGTVPTGSRPAAVAASDAPATDGTPEDKSSKTQENSPEAKTAICTCYGETNETDNKTDSKTRPRPHMPTLSELQTYFADIKCHPVQTISPLQAVNRLGHFVDWVTATVQHHQKVIYDQGLRGEQEMKVIKERHARGEITTREANEIAEKMYSEIVLTNKRMVKWYVGKTDDLLIVALSPDWPASAKGQRRIPAKKSNGPCSSPN